VECRRVLRSAPLYLIGSRPHTTTYNKTKHDATQQNTTQHDTTRHGTTQHIIRKQYKIIPPQVNEPMRMYKEHNTTQGTNIWYQDTARRLNRTTPIGRKALHYSTLTTLHYD
jgi:hypothetical protein